MGTREAYIQRRLRYWAQVIKERNESGMTVRAFCESTGISESSYYNGLKKLRGLALDKLDAIESTGLQIAGTAPAAIPSGWAICETTSAPKTESAVLIEIGACRVSVSQDFDPQLLSKVCRVLVAL